MSSDVTDGQIQRAAGGAFSEIILGDARSCLPAIPSGTIDCVVTDPPYPCVRRGYGYWTEAQWFDLMGVVVPECRRVLKSAGSAVFILQPNSERVGRMRTWLWDFLAKWGREWGVVQDAYWWNTQAMPEAHAIQGRLMRPSVKYAVWLGPPDCHRNQDAVLWGESETMKARMLAERASGVNRGRRLYPSGHEINRTTIGDAAVRRGGVTPFNLLPAPSVDEEQAKRGGRHPAMTPLRVCRWWVRYLCPPGGVVLDPFMGTGTVLLAAALNGFRGVGIEVKSDYCDIARHRLNSPEVFDVVV